MNYWQSRRARKRQIKSDLVRDRPFCHYCNVRLSYKTATLDHYFPKSAGGGDDSWNLVLACQPCNRAKGAKILAYHAEDYEI